MPSPSASAFVRPDIGEAFEEFPLEASQQGFVGLQVAPIFEAGEQSGNYSIIPVEALLEERETKRAPKGGYAESDWEFEQGSFATQEHGAKEVMDDRERKVYAYTIDFEMVCAGRARDAVHRKLERDIALAAQSTTVFGSTAVAVPWSVPQTAKPLDDVVGEIDLFKTGSGVLPNLGVATDKCLRKLKLCAQIQDQLKYAGIDDPKFPMEEFAKKLAQLFDLEKIIVAAAVRNTAKKGQAFIGAQVWDDTKFGLYRAPKSADLNEICALRTIIWTGDGAGIDGVFETYRDEDKRSDMLRFRNERQVKTMYAVAGRLLTGVVV